MCFGQKLKAMGWCEGQRVVVGTAVGLVLSLILFELSVLVFPQVHGLRRAIPSNAIAATDIFEARAIGLIEALLVMSGSIAFAVSYKRLGKKLRSFLWPSLLVVALPLLGVSIYSLFQAEPPAHHPCQIPLCLILLVAALFGEALVLVGSYLGLITAKGLARRG